MKLQFMLTNDNDEPIGSVVRLNIPDGDITQVIRDSTAGIYPMGMEECCELAITMSKILRKYGESYEEDAELTSHAAEEFIDVLIMMMVIMTRNPDIVSNLPIYAAKKEERFVKRSQNHRVIYKSDAARNFAMNNSITQKVPSDNDSFKSIVKKIKNHTISEQDMAKLGDAFKEIGILVANTDDDMFLLFGDSNNAPQYIGAIFDYINKVSPDVAKQTLDIIRQHVEPTSKKPVIPNIEIIQKRRKIERKGRIDKK